MKTIKVKPVESICIELTDKKYICTFNMMSMALMQEEIVKCEGRMDDLSPAHMASLILYCGIKPNDETFTLEEAVALTMNMGPSHYTDIIKLYNESIFDSMDEGDQTQAKKMIAQYLVNAKK